MPAPPQHRGDVLVVDDTPANLTFVATVLKGHGYRVRAVTSGALALRAAALEVPDLVLLDVMMPEMNGFEVCRRLKESERLRDVPVIFLSALSEPLDKVTAFSIGGVDYLTKPFHIEELEARVATHIALRRVQLQLESRARELQQSCAQELEARVGSQLELRRLELELDSRARESEQSAERLELLEQMGRRLAEMIAQNPAAWDELRGVVPHPELLQESHGTWLQEANTACEKLAARLRFARVDIDPGELTEWCRAHRCPVDAEARARFAAEKLRQRDVPTGAAAAAASAYRRQLPPASDLEGAPRDRED